MERTVTYTTINPTEVVIMGLLDNVGNVWTIRAIRQAATAITIAVTIGRQVVSVSSRECVGGGVDPLPIA